MFSKGSHASSNRIVEYDLSFYNVNTKGGHNFHFLLGFQNKSYLKKRGPKLTRTTMKNRDETFERTDPLLECGQQNKKKAWNGSRKCRKTVLWWSSDFPIIGDQRVDRTCLTGSCEEVMLESVSRILTSKLAGVNRDSENAPDLGVISEKTGDGRPWRL